MAATEETIERPPFTQITTSGVTAEQVSIVAHGDRYWVDVAVWLSIFPPKGSERAQLEQLRAIGQRLVEDADMHLAMLPGEGEG